MADRPDLSRHTEVLFLWRHARGQEGGPENFSNSNKLISTIVQSCKANYKSELSAIVDGAGFRVAVCFGKVMPQGRAGLKDHARKPA